MIGYQQTTPATGGAPADERGECSQEATGRRTPQVGAAGHDAQLAGVLVEPAQRLDEVVDLGGELGLGAEAVVGGRDHEAHVGQALEEARAQSRVSRGGRLRWLTRQPPPWT